MKISFKLNFNENEYKNSSFFNIERELPLNTKLMYSHFISRDIGFKQYLFSNRFFITEFDRNLARIERMVTVCGLNPDDYGSYSEALFSINFEDLYVSGVKHV